MPKARQVVAEGCLTDCVIAACGSLTRTTREIRAAIEDHGGIFSPTITTDVTHLIANEEEFEKGSAKIKAAQKHKISIVSEEWLDKIEASGSRPDEELYIIGSSVEKRTAAKKRRKVVEEEEDDDEAYDEEELQHQRMKRERDLREYYLGSLKSLIDDKLFSDLIFVVPTDHTNPNSPTHKIHAHRAVMSANSSILKAMIDKSNKKEGNHIIVDITDVSYDLFNAFLEVAYSGRSKNMKSQHALALIDLCEKYAMTSFAEYLKFSVSTPENVCLLFDSAIQNNNTHIQKWCLAVINRFTDRVVVTSSFRDLSEQAMKTILDSNNLVVQEVVLFERLIEWADNQIEKRGKEHHMELENNNNNGEDIAKDPKAQSKARAEVLAGVLDKIRFPIMSGDELHTVVEPYNVVPDNLLLEGYRYNASPSTFDEETLLTATRFKSRGSSGPRWLHASAVQALRQWTGGKLKMVYHAAKDGLSNSAWRQKVAGITGNITVVKTTQGYIFGGYTSMAWTGRGSYFADSKAFLFSLADGHRKKPEKIAQNGNSAANAVYDMASYGPTFGSGHDLHINFDSKNGYSQLGYAYINPPGANQQTYLAGSYNAWIIEDAVSFSVQK